MFSQTCRQTGGALRGLRGALRLPQRDAPDRRRLLICSKPQRGSSRECRVCLALHLQFMGHVHTMSAQGDWCNQKEDLVGLLREMQINADVIPGPKINLQ